MRNIDTLRIAAAGIFGVVLSMSVGCAGAAGGDAGGPASPEFAVQPGHGTASIPGQDLADGNTNNAFDSTDDLTDPSFVPQPSELVRREATEVAQTSSALSTTTGTTFALTYYVIALRPEGDSNSYTLRDCDGNFLTYASRAFRDDAIMQGTARYRDSAGNSHTINAGQGCWVSLPYSQRWGLGVTNPATNKAFELRPFRSIAVDRSVLTVGNWYYIKELDGVQMPYPASSTVHDGCVRAVDVGPAITGRHIDFYVAYRSAYQNLIGGNSTMGGKESITLYSGSVKCAVHIERGY
jgi:3D (Asp-Asp-Asp) domain-containing protein